MNGSMTVITGCMFSGKTSELQRLLRRHKIAKQVVRLFKPEIDDRYGKNKVVSHDQTRLEAASVPIEDPKMILSLIPHNTTVVGIDEAQFFDPAIVEVCEILLSNGIDIVLAGLKQDSKGELFGSMDRLLVMANFIINPTAVCIVCGDEATMTQWHGDGKAKTGQIVVGGSKEYCAVCHKHHKKA
jgi:thymidine kinase